MSILNPLFDAVAWVMMRIHAVLAVPFGASSGWAWGLSIVLLVVLMRLVMVPLFIKQRNSMWKMQSHMPQLQEIRKRYKHDKQRLNEETMKFYKENGINPLGGCLPLVAQLPVFWSLFNVLKAIADWKPGTMPQYGLTKPVVESARDAQIFGVHLYDKFLFVPTGQVESWGTKGIILAAVLISASTTFLTMRQSQRRGMLNQTAPDPDQPGAAMAQSMSKNMMYIAPFFALTGLYWQFGLVLYWVTTNVWTLGQQHFLFRNLPVVGSATVGASAVQAASGNSGGAARTAAAKSGTSGKGAASSAAARSGATPAKSGTGSTKSGTGSTKAGTAPAKGGTTPAKTGAKAVDTKPANGKAPGKTGASSAPADTVPDAKTKANGAATSGAANGSGSGSSMLRRFGRAKEEPQDVPAVPQTKVVRQQPVRQSRSKRGNSGKR